MIKKKKDLGTSGRQESNVKNKSRGKHNRLSFPLEFSELCLKQNHNIASCGSQCMQRIFLRQLYYE